MALPREMPNLDALIRVPPFHTWLGLTLLEASAEHAVVRVPYKDELIGNPLIPAVHGGITSALVDLAGGAVTFAALGIPTPTIDMRVDFLRPAMAGQDLVAAARAVNIGSTIAYVNVEVFNVPMGASWPHAGAKLVATGRCVYSTKDRGKPLRPGAGPIG
ncbi:MAG: PaaI family thioesterase [Halobacteriales archaeon]|nr:PaaI family thioesterase [Halobacteriales archaeon]